jgi:hydrogenase-4 component F
MGGRWAGDVMLGFGLLSLLVASFSLFRQRDIKRLFAYSSIEHMGIAAFAFGLGGQLATYGALLHMVVHSLTKSSIFFSAGYASQVFGTQSMDGIRGLIRSNKVAGFGLVAGVMAIVGLPPFGVFASEFLILTAVMREAPYLAPPFLVGIGVAFAALITKMQPMAFGEPGDFNPAFRTPVAPILVHMAIVLALGLYMPVFLSDWFEAAVRLII